MVTEDDDCHSVMSAKYIDSETTFQLTDEKTYQSILLSGKSLISAILKDKDKKSFGLITTILENPNKLGDNGWNRLVLELAEHRWDLVTKVLNDRCIQFQKPLLSELCRKAFDQRNMEKFRWLVVEKGGQLSSQDISDLASLQAWDYIDIYINHISEDYDEKTLGDGQYDQVLCQAISSRGDKARKLAKLLLQRGVVSPNIKAKVATVPRYKDILRKGYTGLFLDPDHHNKWRMVKITDVKTENDQPLVRIQYWDDEGKPNKIGVGWFNLNTDVERFFPKFLLTENSTCVVSDKTDKNKSRKATIIKAEGSSVSIRYTNRPKNWDEPIDLDHPETPNRFDLDELHAELRQYTDIIMSDPDSGKPLLDVYCQTDHLDPEILQLLINNDKKVSAQKLSELLFLTIIQSTVVSREIIECLVENGACLSSEHLVQIAESEKFDALLSYLQILGRLDTHDDDEAKILDHHGRYDQVLCQALRSFNNEDKAEEVAKLLIERKMVSPNIIVKVDRSAIDPRYKGMFREGNTVLLQREEEWHSVKITNVDTSENSEPSFNGKISKE